MEVVGRAQDFDDETERISRSRVPDRLSGSAIPH
jgi:hypothetical protein